MNITNDTWIVVADGDKAVFLRNCGDAAEPNFRALQRADRAGGNTSEAAVSAFDRVSGDAGLSQANGRDFAKSLADDLYALAHQGAFDRLVICASSEILAEMHRTLHEDVCRKIIAGLAIADPRAPGEPVEAVPLQKVG